MSVSQQFPDSFLVLSVPYNCAPKTALLNAVSFSEHAVRVPAEHKAQFETSIDSAVE